MTITDVISGADRWHVENADSVDAIVAIPDCTVDAIVCDPPAGISFMGKEWDSAKGGAKRWIAWLRGIMAECCRALKPGGHALIWAIPRTSHWTMTAVEEAGFEVRDVVTHIFGSGFPKSRNVSKDLDAMLGHERQIVGTIKAPGVAITNVEQGAQGRTKTEFVKLSDQAGTPEAKQWDGWGTALKPAAEFWILARKPLEGTVARNVLEHGTGGINVDGCRIGDMGGTAKGSFPNQDSVTAYGNGLNGTCEIVDIGKGRWPANVVLSHGEDCEPATILGTLPRQCAPDCPVAMLDAQSGNRPGMSGGGKHRKDATPGMFGAIDCTHTARGDQGGASRFFYTAKTSTKEREAGCEHLPKHNAAELTDREPDTDGLKSPRAGAGRTSAGRANHHPTVKPLALMRWLVRLVTPPGGVVLDPFCGSGSTGCAAVQEGARFIGVELDPEYTEIARARIAHWAQKESEQQQLLAV